MRNPRSQSHGNNQRTITWTIIMKTNRTASASPYELIRRAQCNPTHRLSAKDVNQFETYAEHNHRTLFNKQKRKKCHVCDTIARHELIAELDCDNHRRLCALVING